MPNVRFKIGNKLSLLAPEYVKIGNRLYLIPNSGASDVVVGGTGAFPFEGQVTQYPSDAFYAPTRAFPSAQGPAANAADFRASGCAIYFITNRSNSDIAGSWKRAFGATGPRIIIPLVWGEIPFTGGIRVDDARFYYAGQFMPAGKGLYWRNRRSSAWGSTERNIIRIDDDNGHAVFRYFKGLRGVESGVPEDSSNIITITGSYPDFVIADHGDYHFATDNVTPAARGNRITWQYNFMGYGIDDAHTKSNHAYGPLMMHDSTVEAASLGNMMTLFRERFPRITGPFTLDIVNNFMFNNAYDGPEVYNNDGEAGPDVNIVANRGLRGRFSPPAGQSGGNNYWMRVGRQYDSSGSGFPTLYLAENLNSYVGPTDDQWNRIIKAFSTDSGSQIFTGSGDSNVSTYRSTARFGLPALREVTAAQAEAEVPKWAGCSYVRNPLTGEIRNVKDSLRRDIEDDINTTLGGTVAGPTSITTRSNFDSRYPNDLGTGGISEADFDTQWFNPWRDQWFPGQGKLDIAPDGRRVIEHFLSHCVPDFPAIPQGDFPSSDQWSS